MLCIFRFFQIYSNCDMFDEQVTLATSSDFQPVKWTFPKTNKCPLRECALLCSNRKAALVHFCAYHASTSIPCLICNELFLASNPLKIFLHYQQKHPNRKQPKLKLASYFRLNVNYLQNHISHVISIFEIKSFSFFFFNRMMIIMMAGGLNKVMKKEKMMMMKNRWKNEKPEHQKYDSFAFSIDLNFLI